MERVILYGMGKYFEECFREVLTQYDVIGVCDRDVGKAIKVLERFSDELSDCDVVKVEDLKEKCDECDSLLITASRYGVLTKYLLESIGLTKEKIKVYISNMVGHTYFYGEHNEDAVISLILSQAGIDPAQIHYVDVGSNDPVSSNNSYYFYCKGASGCLVDPLEEFAYASMVSRPRDKFIRAAVSDISQKETACFYVCDNTALSSLHDEHRKKWDGIASNGLQDKVEVKVIGINDVLQGMDSKTDVIFVDAEGEDIRIVKAIDYEKYGPLIVCVEICGYSEKEIKELVTFMGDKGYTLYTNIKNVNYVFVKDSLID